jgi:hypothetical protein
MRIIIAAAAIVAMTSTAHSQQNTNPQNVLDYLLRQQMEQDAQRRQNEAMRLELERRDLESQLRYQRMSDRDLMNSLTRYCPHVDAPCDRAPPVLVQEAARRGLIRYLPQPRQPGTDCVILGDGLGGGIADCQ